MKLLRLLLCFFVAASFFPFVLCADFRDQDGSGFDEELNESDFKALREFIQTKRDIPLEKKVTQLRIAGDVRAEWRHMEERGRKGSIDGDQENLRGGNAINYGDLPVSKNDFDAEFNLYFEYKTDRSWAVAQVQYDNSCGVFDNNKKCPGQGKNSSQGIIDKVSNGKEKPDPEGWHGSGVCDKLCLKKAYFGYRLYSQCDRNAVVEIGRRRLSNVFDSDVQFLSQFDGICFLLSDKWDWASTAYFNIAGFVVNERINHFGWVLETGLLDICDTGIDLKYSFIDWKKIGRAQCFSKLKKLPPPQNDQPEDWFRNPAAFQFTISQITAYLNFNPDYFSGKPAALYAAFLINHAQPRLKYVSDVEEVLDDKGKPVLNADGKPERKPIFRHTQANLGWYVGFEIGEVKKENDWSLDIEYQYVGAVAVPDGDSRGICRGNILDESFTSIERGNTNYKGWRLEFLYGLTDNITLDTILECSRAANPKIGGHHTYKKFELETIYAF